MYLKIGSSLRPLAEANPEITYQNVFDGRRRLLKVGTTMTIEGRIVLQENASQSAMTIAIEELRRQFKLAQPDVVLLEDDGATPTAIKLLRKDCLTGPDLLEYSLPSNDGRIYATSQPYRAVYFAETLATSQANPILSFTETIEDAGTGGWEKVFVGGAINPSEEQIGRQHSTYRYVQTGSAVGLFNYPPIPPPVWPGSLKRPRPRISRTSPQMVGNVLSNYGISWAYEYESAYELHGKPHTFIG